MSNSLAAIRKRLNISLCTDLDVMNTNQHSARSFFNWVNPRSEPINDLAEKNEQGIKFSGHVTGDFHYPTANSTFECQIDPERFVSIIRKLGGSRFRVQGSKVTTD